MSVPGREELLALLQVQRTPCLSLYMCTNRLGADTQQNPIRLKNLLREAEERLAGAGVRTAEACDLLHQAHDLLPQSHFWRHMSDGLALFMARDFFRTYTVPLNFEEQIVVSNRFYTKPLLPLLVGDGRFYVLALSQGGVRLFEGTRAGIDPVELPGVPASLSESVQSDETPGSLQSRGAAQGAGGAGGEKAGISYGTDVADNTLKRNIVTYFREVDRGIRRTLQDEQVPLVLAGVEYLLPLYQEANTYPRVIDGGVATGTELLDAQALHAKAWPVVEPLFYSERQKAIELYRQLAGEASPKTSDNMREVVPAAYYGRVSTLLLTEGAQQWGRFDPDNGSVTLSAGGEGAGEDLLDLAALYTLRKNGIVYALARAEMPSSGPVAALFRY